MTLLSEGDFAVAVDYMRLCVASSKTYQELTSSETEEQALGTVVFAGKWENDIVEQSRAIVRQDVGLFMSGDENGGAFTGRIPFIVLFEIPVPAEYWNDFEDAVKWVSNKNGKILREMLTNCRQRSWEMPDIRSVEDTVKPGLYDKDDQQGNTIGVFEYRLEAVIEMVLQ